MEESTGSNSVCFEEVDEKITLTVKGHTGNKFSFTMKRHETFLGLKTAYCESRGYGDHKNTRFIWNGKQLCCRDTPNDFGIENGDVIDAVLSLRGC
ncbi:small ubiquitin-related modifier 1-like [Daucus carota subsp. sativus]|uniref:small ubiquitin-related modifier 1-like n=1 Tax=Daucus carota subsp. sativus TaxID=79200 RepID=UPI0007EF4499|nr:PREDICTED: small ubiquitin-related modifier 1-like [Daucus carota subsp. sativus]